MEKLTLKVEGMSCEHCVNAITRAVNALSGVFNVTVDLKTKTATVEYNSALVTPDRIRSKIEEQDYDIIS
ncbi:MAG: copper ion binding protein [Nitrososphaerota archaeon]|jgi:copper chaperone|nr:copper ion binding protein [Nitrososphaerota archaeon]